MIFAKQELKEPGDLNGIPPLLTKKKSWIHPQGISLSRDRST